MNTTFSPTRLRQTPAFRRVLLIGLFLFTLLLTACTAQPAADPTPPPAGGPVSKIQDFDWLVSELRAAGAQVDLGETFEEPYFTADGRTLTINGLNVQVFDFPGEAERQAASGQISPDGFNLGTAMVDWVDQPNFWAHGDLIVQYIGTDQPTIELLTGVLGDPITEQP